LTILLASRLRFSNGKFVECRGETNLRYQRNRVSEKPEVTNPQIAHGVPSESAMAHVVPGGSLVMMWATNKHPGDGGGFVHLDWRLSLFIK